MSFRNLPDDLASRPLTGERLVADVLDLLVGEHDRIKGCILIAMCDTQARLVQPCIIDDLPAQFSPSEVEATIGVFVEAIGAEGDEGSILVALARQSGLSATSKDLEWRAAAERACSGRVTLLGVHLVTLEGSRPIPRSSAAA